MGRRAALRWIVNGGFCRRRDRQSDIGEGAVNEGMPWNGELPFRARNRSLNIGMMIFFGCWALIFGVWAARSIGANSVGSRLGAVPLAAICIAALCLAIRTVHGSVIALDDGVLVRDSTRLKDRLIPWSAIDRFELSGGPRASKRTVVMVLNDGSAVRFGGAAVEPDMISGRKAYATDVAQTFNEILTSQRHNVAAD